MKYKIIGLILIVISCCHISFAQQSPAENFTIKGHIDSIEDGIKVFLFNIQEQQIIDSALSTQGNFILKGHVESPVTCWIQCKGEYAIVQVENTPMEFRSPLKRMFLYSSTKGGREQELQNQLDAQQRPYDHIFYAVYDSLMNKQYADEAHKERLIKEFNKYQDSSRHIYITFGKQHLNSFLGSSILYMNREAIGKDAIKLLLSKMETSNRLTPYAKALEIFAYNQLAEKGKPYIDFEAVAINNTRFKLSSLKGKYILLNFWSAGCGPCRMENRNYSENYNKLKDKITIVSFSMDLNKSQWLKASKTDNILWTNVSDLEGSNGRIKTLYGVQAMPTSFLINKEGVIVEKFIGYDDNFLNQLEKLLID